MTTKIKTIKPVDSSVSLIYACPKCCQKHWISLKAAQTKGYRIVCDCDEVFKVKRVSKMKIFYAKKIAKPLDSQVSNDSPLTSVVKDKVNEIPIDLLDRCVTVLSGYGFTKTEASELIKQTYKLHPVEDVVSLIKLSVSKNLGVNNEQSANQAN